MAQPATGSEEEERNGDGDVRTHPQGQKGKSTSVTSAGGSVSRLQI